MNYKLLQFDDVDLITAQLQDYFKDLLEVTELYGRQVSITEMQRAAPGLLKTFSLLGLNLDTMRVFATPPNKRLPIHVDGSYDDRKDLAINWPIANCANTRMQWFKSNDLDHYQRQSDSRYGKGIKCYNDDECELVEELELTAPAVVKINEPHTVVNATDKNRIVISFRFYNKPEALWNIGTQ